MSIVEKATEIKKIIELAISLLPEIISLVKELVVTIKELKNV